MEAWTDEEVRVFGCLVEKEATVPDSYPLTLNALRNACNQSSARDPVVSYDEMTVQRALDSLKARGVVRFVHPSHGERTTKFRHVAEECLSLDRGPLAALAVLALRGPQTAAEVRSRAERIHAFAGVGEAEAALAALAARDEPLAVELPRMPGQQQPRWAHLLAGPVDADAVAAAAARAPDREPGRPDRVADLEAEVASLRERLERLERELGLQVRS